MSFVYRSTSDDDAVVVDLRDPKIAALLAWIWPGAGHFYQRRFVKGFIFMVCVLSTFLYGMGIGQGRVVYASFRENDFRWQFICQSGIGLPSMVALAQSFKVKNGGEPFFVLCERYPPGHSELDENNRRVLREFEIISAGSRQDYTGETLKDGFMAPPAGPIFLEENDVLGMWHAEMRHLFDLGTLFTVVAGLLNILAIYDAFAGPAILHPKKSEEDSEESDEEKESSDDRKAKKK